MDDPTPSAWDQLVRDLMMQHAQGNPSQGIQDLYDMLGRQQRPMMPMSEESFSSTPMQRAAMGFAGSNPLLRAMGAGR